MDTSATTPRSMTTESRRLWEKALISRFVEETLLDLFSQGKLHGTVHTCIGQEMSGAVITEFLQPGDTIFSNHRCHGHFISRTGDIEGLIAELMGRKTGVCGGLGGSQHLCKDGFYSNGIQGGIMPVAAGLALAHKLRKTTDISVVFIGDGTLGEGVVYETFNLAAKWSLPLLIVLEDNKVAQSTEQHETLAGDIDQRARAFGLETAKADSWDWAGLGQIAGALIGQMRHDGRPRFLRIETYRLKAHSKGDDTRPRDVVAPFEQRDPVNRFLQDLSPEDARWVAALKEKVDRATQKAELAAPAELSADSSAGAGLTSGNRRWTPAAMGDKKRMVIALNETFGQLLEEQESLFLMGEDIESPYGGAFKVTQGLSQKFPERVRNTPISEACIVGVGIGLGLMGFRPLVEIMFGDFVGLAFDQIVNHAAKFRQMYNGQVGTNVTIRTPMGGGRGYGPTHSQTLDRHFLGVPGLTMVALNGLVSPELVYRPLLTSAVGPTLVIENKLLYGAFLPIDLPQGFSLLHSDDRFPAAWLKPDAHAIDITLIGYGGSAELLAEACDVLFEKHDLIVQLLVVTQIYPFSVAPYLDILRRARKLVIVEEGQGFAGFGAEIVAQLMETGDGDAWQCRRVMPPQHSIPSSGPLEKMFLPGLAQVIEAALALENAAARPRIEQRKDDSADRKAGAAPAAAPDPLWPAPAVLKPALPAQCGMIDTVIWQRDHAVATYLEIPYDPQPWEIYAGEFAQTHRMAVSPLLSLMAGRLVALTKEMPALNRTIFEKDDGPMDVIYQQVNLGFTVQAGETLYLAVLRDAGRLDQLDFVKRLSDLQRRALSHKLAPSELSGTTIGFSSMARWGVARHIPVLPPHSAIMVSHTVSGRAPSRAAVLGATYDHRVLSGFDAVRLLKAMVVPPKTEPIDGGK